MRHRLSALLLSVLCGIITPVLADERIEAIREEVRAGNAKRAEELAEALLEVEPDNAAAHNIYGQVLTVRIGEIDRAAGHRAMAAYWTAGDEHGKAAAEYAAAVEAFPEDIELRFEYGLYLQRVEDWDAADTEFTTILASEPDELRARYQVGRNRAFPRQLRGAGPRCSCPYCPDPRISCSAIAPA